MVVVDHFYELIIYLANKVTRLEDGNQQCHHYCAHQYDPATIETPPWNPHPMYMLLYMHHGLMVPCVLQFPKLSYLMWVALKACQTTCLCFPILDHKMKLLWKPYPFVILGLL